MKRNPLFLLLVLPIMGLGQKVDLDRFNFTSQFRTLPNARLDSSYRTYNVSVEGTRLMQSYLMDMTPEKSVYLEGWRLLERNGHINVNVKLEDLLPESISVKERVEIIKDKTGKQTGTRSYYCQEVVYTFASTAEIFDYKGGHITNIVMDSRENKRVYRSPEFALRPLAEGYFMLNALTVTGQLYKNCVNNSMRSLSNNLTQDFGYGETTVSDFMWILDSRKHPEYSAHRNAFLTIKDALFDISASKPITGVREKLQPAIKYFESIKKKYPSSNKHDRKLRYASYFNLAVLYYYLDDPQAMMKEASGLILNDFDARDGRNLEATAVRLRNQFEQTQINTRHFPIDISTLKGPYENAVTTTK